MGSEMIKYTLKCAEGHAFDSWFQSAEAFDGVRNSGHLTCAVCGSSDVEKAMMAPQVQAKRALTSPENEVEQKLADMRKHVEENSTYVGGKFVKEARAMHDGISEERAIWGEAKLDEAKALIDEGIPVAPLPFMPSRKAN